MSKFRKILALVLVAVLCVLTFASCGDTGEDNDPSSSEASGKQPTSEPTKAPTEPKPTEPPTEPPTEKPLVTKTIKEWNGDAILAEFTGLTSASNPAVANGIFSVTSTGGDPNISTAAADLAIPCGDVDIIRFKIKNGTSSYDAQLFFMTTDAPGPNEPNSYRFSYDYSDSPMDSDEWTVVDVYTDECEEGWVGNLKGLRFDFSVAEGDVQIESIQMLQIEE